MLAAGPAVNLIADDADRAAAQAAPPVQIAMFPVPGRCGRTRGATDSSTARRSSSAMCRTILTMPSLSRSNAVSWFLHPS